MNIFGRYQEIQKRRAAGEEGFTLIELLIVIVVLGILAAVVVFALGGVTSQSAVAACNSDAKTVSTAVASYVANTPNISSANGNLPTIANLVTSPITNGPSYLKSAPNSSYYTVGVSTTAPYNVTIALASTDPGAAAGANGSGTTVPETTAEAYEGSSPFGWASTNTISAATGANICAGA